MEIFGNTASMEIFSLNLMHRIEQSDPSLTALRIRGGLMYDPGDDAAIWARLGAAIGITRVCKCII